MFSVVNWSIIFDNVLSATLLVLILNKIQSLLEMMHDDKYNLSIALVIS